MNRVGALGLDGPVPDAELEALGDFLVSPGGQPASSRPARRSDPSVEEGLTKLGYAVDFTTLVLVRELSALASRWHRRGGIPGLSAGLRVERVEPTDVEGLRTFVQVTSAGFRQPGEETSPALLDVGLRAALRTHSDSWVALAGEQVVGGGGCETREGVTAALRDGRPAGVEGPRHPAGTPRGPSGAGAGARQHAGRASALAEGSPTLRNALRFGFTEGYRRRCWTRPEPGQRS